jgi:hypothetical protein
VHEETHRDADLARLRGVLARLVSAGTATARPGGSVLSLFPVAVSAAEGGAIRSGVIAEQAQNAKAACPAPALKAGLWCQQGRHGDP